MMNSQIRNRIKARIITLTAIQLFLIVSLVHAQSEGSNVKDKAEDMFRELNTGDLTLRFINALNGEYVEGARVTINGKKFTSDYEGRVVFEAPIENGQVPVVFEKDGFITAKFDLEMMLGSVWQNRISVSPDLRPESIRIVLDWADDPRDLDAHLIKKDGYHISYRHKRTSDDGTAQLDRDDTNGNGPETITINQVSQGDVYTYMVHDYSHKGNRNSRDLANKSRATVRIYGDNRLMGVYRINKGQKGVEWTVFQISNGHITTIDTVD